MNKRDQATLRGVGAVPGAAARRVATAAATVRRDGPPVAGKQVRSVSQINADARFLIESNFRAVWIEGEISNFRAYASGHWYFSLQDHAAQLRCVMFATRNRFVRFALANGSSVMVRGRLSVYEARGDFQAIVDHIELAGEGALRAAFEQLRAKLSNEGLFADERKRPLPAFPRHIAIITSRDGAALRDVLAVIGRRFPSLRVTCFYVAVQGFEAPGQLLTAFDRAERMRHPPEVIVVTRGGGSLEDLAAFNLESVARRIADATIPVVAAIGHETDVTIADFVADRRAPTPSAAAELVTPDRRELLRRLAGLEQALVARFGAKIRLQHQLLTAVRRRLVHPRRALEQRMLRVDELTERLSVAMQGTLQRKSTSLAHQRQLLTRATPLRRVGLAADRVRQAHGRLNGAADVMRQRLQDRLNALGRALNAVSPLATLERGFAIVAKPTGTRWGEPINSVTQAAAGDRLLAHLADGTLRTQVVETAEKAQRAATMRNAEQAAEGAEDD